MIHFSAIQLKKGADMIVVGGENLIDLVQGRDQDGLPAYVAHPGGSPFNCAMAAARQDAPIGYISPISDDPFGCLLADRLTSTGAKILAPPSKAPTSLAVVTLADGAAQYGFYRDGTAERQVSAASLAATTPQDMTAFHVGSLALTDGADADAWADHFIDAARRGIATSLDPNIRPAFIPDRPAYMARITRMAAQASILKLSDEDLDWMFPGQAPDGAVASLRSIAPRALIVLTRGPDGASAWCGAHTAQLPAPVPDPFVDTVGAGDTVSGTLLAELHHRAALNPAAIAGLGAQDVEAVLGRALRAAALNCQHQGCNPPTRAELA